MSAAEAFAAGNDAFVEEDYAGAVEHYGTAISLDDARPEYYLKRANAFLKLEKYTEAILDTKSALEYDPKSARAYFRQGQAQFAAKSLAEARTSLQLARKYGETNKECERLLKACDDELGAEPAEAPAPEPAAPVVVASDPAAAAPNRDLRIQHDWYQVAGWVTVDVFIKKADPANVAVEFTPTTLSVTVKLPNGADYNLELDLCFQIDPARSKFAVKGTKIEIKMAKGVEVHWPSLEGQGLPGDAGPAVTMASASAEDAVTKRPPGYEQEKKWEQLGAQVEKEEEDERLEGDAALQKLFKSIYKNATPEQMKAMNKSYSESGGTVLSTNWDEIGKEKTPVKPPEGMEFKKWD